MWQDALSGQFDEDFQQESTSLSVATSFSSGNIISSVQNESSEDYILHEIGSITSNFNVDQSTISYDSYAQSGSIISNFDVNQSTISYDSYAQSGSTVSNFDVNQSTFSNDAKLQSSNYWYQSVENNIPEMNAFGYSLNNANNMEYTEESEVMDLSFNGKQSACQISSICSSSSEIVPPSNSLLNGNITDSNKGLNDYSSENNVHLDSSKIIVTDVNDETSISLTTNNISTNGKNDSSQQKLQGKNVSTSKVKRFQNHDLLPPCKNCRLNCVESVSQQEREEVNSAFWKLDFLGRRHFIWKHVKNVPIKRRTSDSKSPRNNNFNYFLFSKKCNSEQKVCKSFFLATLGLSNDFVIRSSLTNVDSITLQPISDGRGKTTDPEKDNRHDAIRKHIYSFNPNVSHYRREHAPNRLYLPDTLTLVEMHNDFSETNPSQSCSYALYRSIFQELNISFAKLGHEECESCENFRLHDESHTKESLDSDCSVCCNWSVHHDNSIKARAKYAKDVEKSYTPSETVYFSVDLEKVIMLPRLEEFKLAAFTRRIVAFNQSFVPIGSNQKSHEPIAVIWHEEISGRKKEDIVSAYHSFFLKLRDIKRIVLWLDNCAGQNKNWCLITFLVYLVNSTEVETDFIELNYFESGHTFMSADSFHHLVESSLKKMKKVYDFEDFSNAIRNCSSSKVVVQALSPSDFRKWEDHASQAKLKNKQRPHFRDIKQIRVTRGSYSFGYNLTYEEKPDLPQFDFLKVKVLKNGISVPEPYNTCRGIPQKKKEDIILKLCPLMPQSRRKFWNNLTVSESLDLIDNYDNEE